MRKLLRELEPGPSEEFLKGLLHEAEAIPLVKSGRKATRLQYKRLSAKTSSSILTASEPTSPVGVVSPQDGFTGLVKSSELRQRVSGDRKLGAQTQEETAKEDRLDDNSNMSTQNRRPPRSGPRGGIQEAGEEAQVWRQIYQQLQVIQNGESKAKEIKEKILALERQIREKEDAGGKRSPEQIEKLDTLYRENLKVAEDQKSYLAEHFTGSNPDGQGGILQEKIGLLKALLEHTEQNADVGTGRGSSSRSAAMDFEGTSDSPGPSSAENKHVRKIGNGRIGSQPPRSSEPIRSDIIPTDGSERSLNKQPKVVFHLGEEVAFKPKSPDKEHDWIQGRVTRVIGEGKSRRYEVLDIDPDAKDATYKSSASSMVPIPPVGAALGPYEVGKFVLALYPETTTFYRAEVKAMVNDGASVQLLFEDETLSAQKIVERRMVLDHKFQ